MGKCIWESVEKLGPPEVQYEEVEVLQELGSGAYGKVYLGKCREQSVAVKVLHKQNLDPKVLVAFKAEVSLLSKIFHPNVCLFMGACFEPGKMMIVSELLPLGDLEGLLYNKELSLSLFTRVRMMVDAARGMTWLHQGEFVVIHRDLKPGNLLVDENYRVKVCDFGLSQIKEKKDEDMMDPKGRIRGSPLWMAPEVLLQQPFNEATDVYAFAIVLWEAIYKKKPYSHIKTLKQLKTEVCRQHVRPPVKNDIPESLQMILNQCWHPEGAKRPAFDKIVDALEKSLIDIAIPGDKDARQIWVENFQGKTSVSYKKFAVVVNKFLGEEKENDPWILSTNDMCLRAMLDLPFDESASGHDTVNIELLGRNLSWLGPLAGQECGDKHLSFYENLRELLSKIWFHGNIATREAEHRLAKRPEGTFLVRFSSRQPGSYTISKVKKGGKLVHQRVEHKEEEFHVGARHYVSLAQLLEKEYENLNLINACPGSSYRGIFEQATGGMYAYEADEDFDSE